MEPGEVKLISHLVAEKRLKGFNHLKSSVMLMSWLGSSGETHQHPLHLNKPRNLLGTARDAKIGGRYRPVKSSLMLMSLL